MPSRLSYYVNSSAKDGGASSLQSMPGESSRLEGLCLKALGFLAIYRFIFRAIENSAYQ